MSSHLTCQNIIKRQQIISAGENVAKREPSGIVGRYVSVGAATMENSIEVLHEIKIKLP